MSVEKSDDSSAKEHKKNKKKLTNKDKLQIQELLKKVLINIAKREFDLAKNQIIEGLTIDKFHTDLNLELAKIYIEEENFTKAEYIYRDLILVHSEDPIILKKLGHVLAIQEKYELATEIYKKAHKEDKSDQEVINMLAQLSFYLTNYEGAIKYSKRFLKIKPKDPEITQILAASYDKNGEDALALESYKSLVVLKPYDKGIVESIKRIKERKS